MVSRMEAEQCESKGGKGTYKAQARELSAALTTARHGGIPTILAASKPEATAGHLPVAMLDEKLDEAPVRIGQSEFDLVDIGWDQSKPSDMVDLVDGLPAEDFWILMRRFNKQVFHLKEAPAPKPGGLDFEVAENEDFSPNKLRAQFERLYMGVLLGTLATVKHISRLRSWREPRRTGGIFLVYSLAWAFNLLIPVFLLSTATLILWPGFRVLLFPPAPIAMVNYHNGDLTAPQAGILGSTDSATGAPEKMKGEAVENEASNFVTGIAAIATNILTDEDPQHSNGQKGGSKTGIFPSPNELVTKVAVMKDNAAGVDRPSQDKTKVPVEEFMWSQMKPLMHMLCVISDTWERFANMFNPIPPFSRRNHRLRLVSFMVTLAIILLFVPDYVLNKITGLCMGLAIFGDPLISKVSTIAKLQKYTLSHTLLHGVPTDAQLAITLLRSGEARSMPLLPPPESQRAPPKKPIELSGKAIDATGTENPLGATNEELRDTAAEHSPRLEHAGGDDEEVSGNKNENEDSKRKKLFHLFKIAARRVAKTAIAVDKIRAKTGSDSARTRLGAVSSPQKLCLSGPVEFQGSYDGKNGFVYLTTNLASPALCFSETSATNGMVDAGQKGACPMWIVPVGDIVELNKFSGYGTKAKMMAGWALDRAIMDGLEIVDRGGKCIMITGLPHRDQLFNRLCSLGHQNWEIF